MTVMDDSIESGKNNRRKFIGNTLFVLSWVCVLWSIVAENLRHWMLIHEKTFHSDLGWAFIHVSDWAAVLFPVIIASGLALFQPKLQLFERWLILIVIISIWALSSCYGYQNPYIDNRYMDEPLTYFADTWSSYILVVFFIIGLPILSLCTLFRVKMIHRRPLWLQIIVHTLLWGTLGFAIYLFIKLFPDC